MITALKNDSIANTKDILGLEITKILRICPKEFCESHFWQGKAAPKFVYMWDRPKLLSSNSYVYTFDPNIYTGGIKDVRRN
jgi:hypothetical protein